MAILLKTLEFWAPQGYLIYMILSHEEYMKMAIEEALKGQGHVSPNPVVGAILVKDDKIIGRGFHEKYGSHHAEVNAIANASESVEGATLYCSLEPCCHTNKQTPPCVDLIIEKKIAKVVVASRDRNPSVDGKGFKKLREHGIEVVESVLEDEADIINEEFFYAIQNEESFIHLKFAMTLDGKIATSNCDSKWISSEAARTEVHELRNKYDAILIGGETLSQDNPTLDVRMNVELKGSNPKIIVMGSINRLREDLNIFKNEVPVVWFTRNYPTEQQFKLIKEKKVSIVFGDFSIAEIRKLLFKEYRINSLLIEGGSEILSEAINEEQYQKITAYISPILLGEGVPFFKADRKNESIKDALKLNGKITSRMINEQLVLEVNNVHRPS